MKKTKQLLLSLLYFFLVLDPVLADEKTFVSNSIQPRLKISYAGQESKNQNNNLTKSTSANELSLAINNVNITSRVDANLPPFRVISDQILQGLRYQANCGITNEQEQLSKILVTDIQNYLTQSQFEEFKNSEPKNCDLKQLQYRQEIYRMLNLDE